MQKGNKPLKKFGQNFLIDPNIIEKIIREINPLEKETIFEIGPGKGAITTEILKRSSDVWAVEIDFSLFNFLRNNLKGIKLLNLDFLKLNLTELFKSNKIRVVGNIPYNITSPILFKLIREREVVRDAVLMVQDEVAKRIIAGPNSKDYGVLSVILSYFANVSYCFKISKNVFYPKPSVNSALIHIIFKQNKLDVEEEFIAVVKAAFNYRRKMLKNSLSNGIFKNCDFKKINFDLNKRPENLDVNDFLKLTKELIRNNCW